jgi:nickel/cobalt exporter
MAAAAVLPAMALAHPLGNFTINHYAGISVGPLEATLDVVIDEAEIPAFQSRQGMDADGDGAVSTAEADAGRLAACAELAGRLDLRIAGATQSLILTTSHLAFPPGAGGLTTMRLECGFVARPEGGIAQATMIAFSDGSFPERIGWREIVVDPAVVVGGTSGEPRTVGVSQRLTHYPAGLLTTPLDDRSVAFAATPTPATVDAAEPVPTSAISPAPAAVVPGGVLPGDLPDLLRAADVSPLVLLGSLLVAAALGAGHALTPGHGKTLMAAYLVGTRGTARHAVGLGLSVTASHTIGILVLAAVIVGAQDLVAPDLVIRAAPVAAAISILLIGGWMLVSELRRRRAGRGHDHAHGHDDAHGHEHAHGHDVAHADPQPHPHDHDAETDHGHTHAPVTGTTITWRGLFALGLAGGLIPSTSALLILLSAVAAGRPAMGFVLVVAFGIGMAVVMGGIGLALVLARGRLDTLDPASPAGRAGAAVPLVAAVVVLGFGIWLTANSVGGAVTL